MVARWRRSTRPSEKRRGSKGSTSSSPESRSSAATVRIPGARRRPLDRVGPVPPEKLHWSHLYTEVVTSGLCTGCSACVVVCPYDVLGYDDTDGNYKPFHVPEEGGPDDCTHGVKGCTLCTRACPRFRTWEPEIDNLRF